MLQISRNQKTSFTYEDILKCKYPDLFERVEEQRDRLAELQNKLLTLIPKSKIVLPNMRLLHKALNSIETQTGTQAKITLHSLYNFADKAYLQVKNACEVLAKLINGESIEGYDNLTEADAHAYLDDLLDKLTIVNAQFAPALLDNIGVVGLLRLQRIADYMGTKYDLHDFNAIGKWTFRDIVGTVTAKGYFSLPMVMDATAEPIPVAITVVGEIVDNKELERIY